MKHLLKRDTYKGIVMDSLQTLVDRKSLCIYGFVIMPNHIHLVWEMLEPTGKEMPHASFNKFTSHSIVADLKANHLQVLPYFRVDEMTASIVSGNATH
jgi:putative transposase